MERFPDEVLMMILDYLPSHVMCLTVARVCRRWARLAGTRAALVPDARAYRRWRSSRGVRALLLTAHEPLLSSAMPLLPAARHLTELSVHLGLALSTNELLMLAQLRLRHVDVFCRAEVLNAAAVPLASRVSSLVLNEPVSVAFLSTLAENCRLTALHMYGRAGCYPRDELLELLESRAERLEELTLRCHVLQDQHYAAIGRCRRLHSLQLYSCRELTSAAAMQLTSLQGLRKLHLTGTYRWLDGEALMSVMARLPRGLAELSLSAARLQDHHVTELVWRDSRLRRVELWRTQLSARGLLRLATLLTLLQELDVDVEMPRRILLALGQHPTLETVRCRLPQEKVETHLRLLDAQQCHGGRVTRSEGDGYRAQLFYYWTQDVPPAPPRAAPPPTPRATVANNTQQLFYH